MPVSRFAPRSSRSILLVACTCLASPAQARSSPSLAGKDSDQDGLEDALERETGTDPFNADSDSDSVDDGAEDRDRDGRVSPGESDPRTPGLFPGSAPHIPEPQIFDLVRGLGAERGELEVNTLVVVNARTGRVAWAPEVEWAFAKGHAIELELPLVDRELEAVKLALQGTLPSPWRSFTHGWQVFAEVGLEAGQTDGVGVYLLGQRFAARWSYLVMAGAKVPILGAGQMHLEEEPRGDASALANVSLFVDVREWQTWGIETNAAVSGAGHWTVRVFPQVHLQLGERIRFQLSAGMEAQADAISALFALRGIVE